MTNENTLAAIAADVQSGETGIVAALGKAYALGYAAGLADGHERDAARIVRVGEVFKTEVQSDAH